MTEIQIVSVISLVGFLILAIGVLKTHRVDLKRTLVMAGAWFAIFGIVALSIGAIA